MVSSVSICGKIYIIIPIGLEMLHYDANLAIKWIFKKMSQISDIKQVHCGIVQGTSQTLLSPSSYPAVNDDLW